MTASNKPAQLHMEAGQSFPATNSVRGPFSTCRQYGSLKLPRLQQRDVQGADVSISLWNRDCLGECTCSAQRTLISISLWPLTRSLAADALTSEQQKDFRQAVDTFGVQSARAQVTWEPAIHEAKGPAVAAG